MTALLDKSCLVVRAITQETDAIKSFELVDAHGELLPKVEAGAHLTFHLGNGLNRFYSLYDQPGENRVYHVAVLNDPASRGGSAYLHEQVKVGDRLSVSGPNNHFKISADTRSAVLIAGGIGVTPIIAMARDFYIRGIPFEFQYCAKTEQDAAFVTQLREREPYAKNVHFHFDGGDPRQGVNLQQILATSDPEAHLYCCGPEGLMNAVENSVDWPEYRVHFERFKAEFVSNEQNQAFSVVLSQSGQILEIPAEQSIMQVLREQGMAVDSVCEEGICGACLTDVLEGQPDHRDKILTKQEQDADDVIAICCSRSKTERLVLDI